MSFSRLSFRSALLAVSAVALSLSFDGYDSDAQSRASLGVSPAAQSDPVLVGAGDIASCGSSGAERTARLLDDIPGTVFTLGDNAYQSKGVDNPFPCYNRSWGRHKKRTRPIPGNHEYEGGYVDEYFDYFRDAAGDRGKGYYSYDLGEWHIIALNTMVRASPSSSQGKWLANDLEKNSRFCTLAYFHHPRFSSGPNPVNGRAELLWDVLAAAGVDVVVAGHDHLYERFAPMDPDGSRDDRTGMRQFVVGTGGYSHYDFASDAENSEVRNNTTYGVIKLTLHARSYDWQFVPVRGRHFTDKGSSNCH